MNIKITDSECVKDLQEQFQKAYPFLKIEFSRNTWDKAKPLQKFLNIPPKTPIGVIRQIHTEGTIDICPKRTVEEIEKEFWENFGLHIQVFRKSSNMWIETTLTDHWSLLRQNIEGQQMSSL